VARSNIAILIVKRNFSKIVPFKRAIRKFLNMVAAHIEGLRYPPICLFETLFRVNVPLMGTLVLHGPNDLCDKGRSIYDTILLFPILLQGIQ
jgi:hypothetical protein